MKAWYLFPLVTGFAIYPGRFLFRPPAPVSASASQEAPAQHPLEPGVDEALASYEKGIGDASGKPLADLLDSERLAGATFSQRAYQYGVRDAWLKTALNLGVAHLVEETLANYSRLITVFGEDIILDAVFTGLCIDPVTTLSVLRSNAPPVMESPILARLARKLPIARMPDLLPIVLTLAQFREARSAELFAAAKEWQHGACQEAWKKIPKDIRRFFGKQLATAWPALPIPACFDNNDLWSFTEGKIEAADERAVAALAKATFSGRFWVFKLYSPGHLFQKWAALDYDEARKWLETQTGNNRSVLHLFEVLYSTAVEKGDSAEIARLMDLLTERFKRPPVELLKPGSDIATTIAAANKSKGDNLRRALHSPLNYPNELLDSMRSHPAASPETRLAADLELAFRDADVSLMDGAEVNAYLSERLGPEGLRKAWTRLVQTNPPAALQLLASSTDPDILAPRSTNALGTFLYRQNKLASLDIIINSAENRPDIAPVLLGGFIGEWARDDAPAVSHWFQEQDLSNIMMQNTLSRVLGRMVLVDPICAAELSQLSTDARMRAAVVSTIENLPDSPPLQPK